MNIGTQIQKIRRKNNISQGQFAKDCGITQTYLSLIEHNKKDPNISLLKVITAKLNIPLSLLLLMSLFQKINSNFLMRLLLKSALLLYHYC